MQPIVSISNLSKIYASGHHALKDVNLDIAPGEILALLGPNGAGKTTLISIICGIVNASEGTVTVADLVRTIPREELVDLVEEEHHATGGGVNLLA